MNNENENRGLKEEFDFLKDKDSYKRYKKLLKYYKCELKKSANNWQPTDFGFTLTMMKICLQGMLAYYIAGDNVWAKEIEGHDRATTIAKALKLLQRYENCFLDTDEEGNPLEEQAWKDFCKYLGEEMLYWWD